ncbi:MAG: regulatory protein GemA [Alphaproteobacteria bacterium]|nr:regulatory protein GemA [Alphaproteobacteria bacterium]
MAVIVKRIYAPRNQLIKLIHVAKKRVCMEEDSYRAMLVRVTKKSSTKDMSELELEKVVKEFERLGFVSTSKRAGKRPRCDDEQSTKIRALWLNLYHLGALRDPSEEALVAHCKRMTKVQALQWLTSSDADKVIKSLRGWLDRLGWRHPTTDCVRYIKQLRARHRADADPLYVNFNGVAAKAAVIRAQYRILERPMTGFDPDLMDADSMDNLIETLGIQCRARKAEDA